MKNWSIFSSNFRVFSERENFVWSRKKRPATIFEKETAARKFEYLYFVHLDFLKFESSVKKITIFLLTSGNVPEDTLLSAFKTKALNLTKRTI